ncbi:MAG: multicopper oxidase domain-containing protein [Verrucomicrobia bacterium]|nr:multicopper oxidase domain-containing protein [Verrucomicrobiota bacterium]
MKAKSACVAMGWLVVAGLLAPVASHAAASAYNQLLIPPVLTGPVFNLSLGQTNKAFWANLNKPNFYPNAATPTTTYSYNGLNFLGPTLIMNKGDSVQINVTNTLIDTTTVHWHGFHIPAIMDGGPHQTIPGGTVWSPMFNVKNDAATYWYHPHLHETTHEQVTKGAAGMIIVRDAVEASLPLPRTYGVDDIPLIVMTRRFLTNLVNGETQLAYNHVVDNYGDYVVVNGAISNQVSLPKQVVRFRVLNADVARGYYLGFSDNRTFYVIGNDQGLLNTNVPVSRMRLMIGERVELLLNLGADTLGSSVDLMAWNSEINGSGVANPEFGFPGVEGNPNNPSGNEPAQPNGGRLNHTNFPILNIVVTNATTTPVPITNIPATLVTNTYWTTNDATSTRNISVTQGQGGAEFRFNNLTFTPTLFNHTINLNAVEKWVVTNNNVFGHAFHIHDIKFNIVNRNSGPNTPQVASSNNGPPAQYESGWKDTFYLPRNESATVLAKFDDFASNQNPFMFHCHFLHHEDGGMMGQFVVVNNAAEELLLASTTRTGAQTNIVFTFTSAAGSTYAVQYAGASNGNFQPVGIATNLGATATFTDTNATRLASNGFYKITQPLLTVASCARTGTNSFTGTNQTSQAYENIALKFSASTNTTYLVQFSTDLTSGSWTNVGAVTSDGTAANYVETNVTRLAIPRAFYRVQMPVVQ